MFCKTVSQSSTQNSEDPTLKDVGGKAQESETIQREDTLTEDLADDEGIVINVPSGCEDLSHSPGDVNTSGQQEVVQENPGPQDSAEHQNSEEQQTSEEQEDSAEKQDIVQDFVVTKPTAVRRENSLTPRKSWNRNQRVGRYLFTLCLCVCDAWLTSLNK